MRAFSPASVDYLERLKRTLSPIESDASKDLIREFEGELHGLSEAESLERIRQLGEPSEIAGHFKLESDAPWMPSRKAGRMELLGLSVYGLGWIPFSFIAWVIGVALIANSAFWTQRQKVVAAMLPALVLVSFAFLAFLWTFLATKSLSAPVAWTALVAGNLGGGIASTLIAFQMFARQLKG